jgi:hypothetical protein
MIIFIEAMLHVGCFCACVSNLHYIGQSSIKNQGLIALHVIFFMVSCNLVS